MKENKTLCDLKKELHDLQTNNPQLCVHYTPIYDSGRDKWYIIMHQVGGRAGSDCDDAKKEAPAYKKAISWMKREIKGYEYELKHPHTI